MAIRKIFIPDQTRIGVIEKQVEFQWYPGLSFSQKQKSVQSLHDACKHLGIENILEISTKSFDLLGQKLSAFNLMTTLPKTNKKITIESAFQGSKVFEKSGPYTDIYEKKSIEAKKDIRLKTSGNLCSFDFCGQKFSIKPKTFFYDWLYVNALFQHKDYLEQIKKFNAFTDIEFNDVKSINCQARSVALCLSLLCNNISEKSIQKSEEFYDITKNYYTNNDTNKNHHIQGSFSF